MGRKESNQTNKHIFNLYEEAKAFCNLHEKTKTFHCIFDDNSTIIFFKYIFV